MPRRAPSRLLWEARPAANASLRPAQKQKASPRGRGSYKKPRRAPSRLLWEPRPAANASSQPAQKQKLRPEGGAPTRSHSAHRAAFCGSRDPRLTRACGPLKSKKLRPEGGAPTKKAKARTEPPFVGAATRGEWGLAARSKSKSFAPRAGLLQRKPKRAPSAFCGSRDPRRMRACSPLKKQKLRPEGGAPTRSHDAHRAAFCGSRDPRRKRACCRLKSKASPRGRGSYRKPRRAPSRLLWEPRPAANGGLQPAQKLRPEGGAPTKKAKARTEPLLWEAPRGNYQIPEKQNPAQGGVCHRVAQRQAGLVRVGCIRP